MASMLLCDVRTNAMLEKQVLNQVKGRQKVYYLNTPLMENPTTNASVNQQPVNTHLPRQTLPTFSRPQLLRLLEHRTEIFVRSHPECKSPNHSKSPNRKVHRISRDLGSINLENKQLQYRSSKAFTRKLTKDQKFSNH